MASRAASKRARSRATNVDFSKHTEVGSREGGAEKAAEYVYREEIRTEKIN